MFRLTFVLAGLCLAACGPSPEVRATMANPASQNCIADGGHLTVRKTSQGPKGYCTMPNGRTLDVWEHFHQTHP